MAKSFLGVGEKSTAVHANSQALLSKKETSNKYLYLRYLAARFAAADPLARDRCDHLVQGAHPFRRRRGRHARAKKSMTAGVFLVLGQKTAGRRAPEKPGATCPKFVLGTHPGLCKLNRGLLHRTYCPV